MLEIPKSYCGKRPGDRVRLFFRTGQEQRGSKVYERDYRIEKFYPFIILCTDENRLNRCFGYWKFRKRLTVRGAMRMK